MSHVSAGGRLPGADALGFLFAALTVQGAVLFGSSRRRFDVVALVLGGTQFSLHLVFRHLSVPNGGGRTMPAGHAAHHMAGRMTGEHMNMAPADVSGVSSGHGAGHSMTAAMTLAHAVATLGTALCVIYAERVLQRLAALVVPDIGFRSPPPLPFAPRLRPMPPPVVHTGFGVLLARSRPRRGPPPAAPA
ncbi:hypothetical protein ACFYXH_23400 [Streptomyces sp. NPDC002730]|uniref:hypothetical protein n=1 Tax=Streptomyces sp. NPDC002730 TaxID=3364662 RepID=UPI0036A742DA